MDSANRKTPRRTGKSRRTRRPPETARREALDCARRLLLEQGPAAITLTAVAKSIGVTHGTITYHFGTVAALHRALVERMAEDLAETMHTAVLEMREGRVHAEEIVDTAFRAFDEQGAGRLVAWLVSTHQTELLQPLFNAVQEVTQRLERGEPRETNPAERGARITTLMLMTTALGAALIGGPLGEAVRLDKSDLKRQVAAELKALRATPIR